MTSLPTLPRVGPQRQEAFGDDKGSADASVDKVETGLVDGKPEVSVADVDDQWATKFNEKGEPIINTGHDVSRHLIVNRDDGDPALTLRACLLGASLNVLNNTMNALFSVKPTGASITDIFNMLILYAFGNLWAKTLPDPNYFTNSTLKKVFAVINPSKTFGIKEHVFALLLTSVGYLGGYAVSPLIVCKLFFNTHLSGIVIFIGVLSLCTLGIGLVGLLAPAIVYPSEMVYWTVVPTIHAIQALHYSKDDNRRRLRIFSLFLGGAFLWEIVPAYMMPWLNGISIPCMASVGASWSTRKTIARLFGGASPNQGLGLLSISLDPQYVAFSQFAGYPLKWQVQYFGGAITGAVFLIALYYGNAWNAKSLPMMTPTLFSETGDVWDQDSVFDANYRLNVTALATEGLPRMTVSEAWYIMCSAMGIGALIVHVIIFLGKEVLNDFKRCRNGTLDDPHWQDMQKYKEVPKWVYLCFIVVALPLSYITIYVGDTTLPWWGLTIALIFGTLMTPISLSIYGRYGSAVPTTMASKILAGTVHPDRPVANLWFAVFSHQVVETAGTIAGFLKFGQYLRIPPRINLAAQLFSLLSGAYIQYFILSGIVAEKADILRDPQGDRNWYGGVFQDMNTQGIIWSLTSRMFSPKVGMGYEWVPCGIFIGAVVPVIHWLLTKKVEWIRKAGPMITTPIWLFYLQTLGGGINSSFLSSMILAIFCQLWLRVKRPKMFIDFNYVVAAGVDGGVAIMIFVLSFTVFGAAGISKPFPTWWGNPELPVSPDQCIHPDRVH